MSIHIKLTDDDLLRAEAEAKRRQSHNESRRTKGRNNAPARGDAALEMHRIGCIGELAVARYLDMEDHVFTLQSPIPGSADLPFNIEVKTRSKHGYDLLIQLNDDPNKLFVLVTYSRDSGDKTAKIVGWAYGRHVMKKEYIREFVRGRPCYAVPQAQLSDPGSLLAEIGNPVQPREPLSEEDAWMTCHEDEMILNFSPGLLDALGWKPGDLLIWQSDPSNNSIYLKKKQ